MFKVGGKVKLSQGGIDVFNRHSKTKVSSMDEFKITDIINSGTLNVLHEPSGVEWYVSSDLVEALCQVKHEKSRSMVSFCKIIAPLQFAIVLLACFAIGITPELNVPVWALAGSVFFSCILMCFLSLAAAGVEILDNLLGESDER